MKKETLTFLRMATKSKDGKDGVLYIHSWNNGYQELIFDNNDAAKNYQATLNDPLKLSDRLKLPA